MNGKRLRKIAALIVPFMFLLGLMACSGIGVSTTTTTDITGIDLSDKIDANGVLLDDVEVFSNDGVASLKLTRGTKALDGSGNPITSLNILSKFSLTPWYSYSLYKTSYALQPDGAVFSQPAVLTFIYTPTNVMSSVDESSAIVGYFDPSQSEWSAVPDVQVDVELKRVSVEIDHLGMYALYYPFPLS